MKSRNGTDYAQNYDIIVRLMAGALKGETLEVIGVKTGRIIKVFGFEPADISVRTGRVDVILKDENDAYFHFEEQRNLTKKDMHRFGAYHFMGAEQWPNLTDIILASGDVAFQKKKIETPSGRYEPIIINFTEKDGKKRLEEIRSEIKKNRFGNLLELVFLPLYGKETGEERSEMVKEIIRFEAGLFHKKIISAELLAAAMAMSNKMVGKEFLEEIWEGIKMLDIIDFAKEKGVAEGLERGLEKGIEKGKLGTAREMLTDAFNEKFGFMPIRISERIGAIRQPDTLKFLFRQMFRCDNLEAFEKILERAEG